MTVKRVWYSSVGTVVLSKLTMASSSPWPSCLAASLTSLIYSSMSSLAGSKEKVLHLSCKCLILQPWVEKCLLKYFVNSSQLPWKRRPLSKLWYNSHAMWFKVCLNLSIYWSSLKHIASIQSSVTYMWASCLLPGSPLKMGGGIFTQGISSSSESKSGLRLGSGRIPPCACLCRAHWNLHLWPGLACRLTSWSASTRFPRRSIGSGGKGSRGWHPHAPPWGGSQGPWGAEASCSLSSPAPCPLAFWYSPSSPSAPSSPTWIAFPWSSCLVAVAIVKIYRWGWDLPMQIPKCKYLRASGERVLENVFRLGSTCSVSSGGMWACYWSHCPFPYMNVCEVTSHVASHVAGQVASHLYLCLCLLCNEAVETLEAPEAVLVWVCS